MPISPFRRSVALALSLVLGSGLAVATASAAQADPSNDATLSSLTVSTGTIDVPFDPAQANSHVTVAYDTTSFSFTPTTNDQDATMTSWNGSDLVVPANGAEVAVPVLQVGDNIFTVNVTAQDEVTTKQYTLVVYKPAPPPPLYDLDLSGLTVSEGTLSPAFDPDVTFYSVDLPWETTSITFAPTAVDSGNTVTVQDAASGTVDPTVALFASNTVLITVTAPDATNQVYVVQVTRGPVPTADVDLASIDLSNGTLSPSFDPDVQFYTATVPYAVRSMQIGATAEDSDNTVAVNNVPIADGVPVTVPLIFSGSNGFAISVTADNGIQKIYIVTITRDQPSNDADLTDLSLTEGTLSPEFSNDETKYTASVPYLTTSTAVAATVADATAIVRVNNHDTASGDVSAPISLAVGANTITVVTTAEDTVTTTTHTIVITRQAPDLDLNTLTVTGGTLSPDFHAATTGYALSLPYPTTSVDVAAAAVDPDWAVQIQGEEVGAKTIAVPVGASTITVTVTALYGEARDYTIAVTRAAPSTDATLGGITLSEGSLSPAFSPDATEYTVAVPYQTEQLELGASVADETASLTINGDDVSSAMVPLAVGANTITIVTTAQDGVTTLTTTVVVTRAVAPSVVIHFDLGFKAGDAVTDAPFSVTGANLLPGSSASVTLHSTPVVLVTGTVGADGTITLSGRLPANIEPGAHQLVFDGTALDGTAVTASAWFTVLRNGTVGAVSLSGPVAYVEPAAVEPAAVEPAALASTGVDGGSVLTAAGTLAAVGALLFLLGGLLRRRRRAA